MWISKHSGQHGQPVSYRYRLFSHFGHSNEGCTVQIQMQIQNLLILFSRVRSAVITLCHKIITYEELFWNKYFHKNYYCLYFLEISRVQNVSKITKKNSHGIILEIMSCQRVQGQVKSINSTFCGPKWPVSDPLFYSQTPLWKVLLCVSVLTSKIQKNVRNPSHHYFSNKYCNTHPICSAVRLQFLLQRFRCHWALRKGKYFSTLPICIAARLPFVSQYASHCITICLRIVSQCFGEKSWWLWSPGCSPILSQEMRLGRTQRAPSQRAPRGCENLDKLLRFK